MNPKIISVQPGNTILYTIKEEKVPAIYKIEITTQMVKAANENFKGQSAGEASFCVEIIKTIQGFHKFLGQKIEVCIGKYRFSDTFSIN